jgi:putative superfamily III holin-X
MAEPQERSTTGLMADLLEQVTQLVRKEVQLFRAEMSDKTSQVIASAGSILAGAVLAITALNVLAAALVSWLTRMGIPEPWSAVIVGLVLAVIAYVLARKGIDNLKAGSLAPERTTRAAVRDVSMVKEKI